MTPRVSLEAGWERQQRHDLARPLLASMLCRYAGLTQREVAPLLGLTTGAAVSLQVKRLNSARVGDRTLARQLERIEKALEALLKKETAKI